jgi:hypothetical protein
MAQEPDPSARGGHRFNRWWVTGSVLVLIGTASLAGGLETHRHPLAGPVAASPTTSPRALRSERTPLTETVPSITRSAPVSLSIPAIGISVSLSRLGLNPTGTVQVPTDVQQPGWYDLGPSPGEMGSSVILGHVDTSGGPAIFFHLPTMRAGEDVTVTLADGVVATFRVRSVESYLKTQFPAKLVYGTHGDSALQLVTCGGAFDTATGHYLSNVVVFTTLVTTTPATRS